jgi:hypothetical protein
MCGLVFQALVATMLSNKGHQYCLVEWCRVIFMCIVNIYVSIHGCYLLLFLFYLQSVHLSRQKCCVYISDVTYLILHMQIQIIV